VPDAGGEQFKMLFESGHSLGRKADFSLPMASLAGHALETGELQWTNDVEKDQRWHPHPKASAERGYCSLASMPIVVGDDAVGVLNVVSSAKGAFLKSDLTYVELLGGFIGLAWALNDGDGSEASHRLTSSQEPAALERKGT
jgi:GAF domain-containing protein